MQRILPPVFGKSWAIAVLLLLAWAATVQATPPSTPIMVQLSLSHPPGLNEWVTLTVTVTSVVDAPGTLVELVLPAGVVSPTPSWTVDLYANRPVSLSSPVFVQVTGNVTLSARALKAVGPQTVWGDMKSVPVTVGSPVSGPSQRGWQVTHVPVAALAQPGDTPPLSSQPTPFAFPSPSPHSPGGAPDALPSTIPQETADGAAAAPSSPGNVTLTGRWRYADRSSVDQDIDQQLIEIRRGDGSALSPPVYCFTAADGTFSCTFPHPGTTMRVWVRSWTNFNRPGGADRLGVFSGPEVTGGCGSDSVDCSYPVQTAEVACADGASCDVGTWTVSAATPEPWIGAHWMTQDLIRSWKKLFFDVKHGTGTSAGPGRITYPVPSGHGTHAHVPPGDGWISIEPPFQQSADIVLHEYGHVVMANLWGGFTPNWPSSDCPNPHFIQSVSGPGCALSEGFADFWAWYSNEFYDGDSVSGNEGPIFNWPGGASTNLETRDGGTYQAGDQVEGNIAAVFGDILDAANDGPASGPSDRLADGIQHIWHTLSSQSDNNFSEWFNAYRASVEHDPCPVLSIINFNSIGYALSQCPPQLITVTSPNGGEIWPIGSPRNITWTSSGLTGNVKIEVSRNGGASWALIIGSTANDGIHSWTVTGPATTQARIRVTSLTDPTVADMSNANVTLGGGSITVTSPNGGEIWPIGSPRNITWTSSGLTGNVKIEVSRNGGASWASIIASTVNDGTHSWTVTGPGTTQARIRVTSLTDPTVADMSNANVTLGGGSITVTSPNGGEIWPIGSPRNITWTSSGLTGNVKIEVSRNGGASWASIIASTVNDGTHSWTVTGPGTTQARIRVTSLTDTTVADMSNTNATLGGGSITVTSPNGGEIWPIGSAHNISWTSSGLTGNVKIEVSRNGGASWASIIASTVNDGTHSWVVTGPATTQARIRVTSLTDPTVADMSNANATLGGGSITVTSPNGGEIWLIGSPRTITWTSSGLTGNVKIEVSRNGGASWASIIASTPNDGTHSWTVASPVSTQARIRVTSVTDPTVFDTSNANFTIQ